MFRLLLLVSVLVTSHLSAEPVSTTQFGFIRPYMTEAEVVQRLGPPDTRLILKRYVVVTRTSQGALAETREQVQLFYQGDSTTMHTTILLDHGRVVHTHKYK